MLSSSDFKTPLKFYNWLIFNHLTEVWKVTEKENLKKNICPNWWKIGLLVKKLQPQTLLGHPTLNHIFLGLLTTKIMFLTICLYPYTRWPKKRIEYLGREKSFLSSLCASRMFVGHLLILMHVSIKISSFKNLLHFSLFYLLIILFPLSLQVISSFIYLII